MPQSLNYQFSLLTIFSVVCSSAVAEEINDWAESDITNTATNLITLGYSKNSADYFSDGSNQLKPSGTHFSIARQISEQWILELNHQKESGNAQWLVREGVAVELFDNAKIKSENTGVSAIWQGNDFGLSMSYTEGDSLEDAELFLPHLLESLASDERVLSVSYDRSVDLSDDIHPSHWSLDWSVGVQYAKIDLEIVDTLLSENPINLASNIHQKSSSGYADIGIAYDIEEKSFAWSPYLSLSWNWEISSDGEELTLVSRGDREIILDEPGTRLSNGFRTPNSGTIDFGVDFSWKNGVSTNIGYGRNVSTEFSSENIYVDVSVAF